MGGKKEADMENLWDQALQIIKDNITQENYETWVKPIRPVSLKNGVLLLEVPSHFAYEHIDKNFSHLFKKAIEKVTGNTSITIKYLIPYTGMQLQESGKIPHGTITKTESSSTPDNIENIHPWIVPGIKKKLQNSNLNHKMTFETFICPDNDTGLSTVVKLARRIPDMRSDITTVVLFYGDYGVGKTHLVNAIGWEYRSKYPDFSVYYTEATPFVQMIYDSFSQKTYSSLIRELEEKNVLIIDDIQYLEAMSKGQQVLFEIMEYFCKKGKETSLKKLLLVSDRPPDRLTMLEGRLLSRLKGALLIEVPKPSFATLKEIIKRMLKMASVDNVSEELIDYIASQNITPRDVEGIISSIVVHQFINSDEGITREVVDKILKKYNVISTSKITVADVIREVASFYGLTEEIIKSKTKSAKVALARHIISYIARTYLNETTITIAKELGDKDHSSVVYGSSSISSKIPKDRQLASDVKSIVSKLGLNKTYS